MPREFSRNQRMAEQLRRELSEIVRKEIKDPRMGFSSFTEVRVSRDLAHAVVYCSVFETDKQKETIETLNRASGFLRRAIASRIHARIVPTIKFVIDDSVARGAAMDKLIQKAVDSDNKHDAEPDADNS